MEHSMNKKHTYQITISWTGNLGTGTSAYNRYERSHFISNEGKPSILCSSDPLFLGDPSKWNPEELLLASIANCHMLWYLHLCADNKVIVHSYQDHPTAVMRIKKDGSGRCVEVNLRPKTEITDLQQKELAKQLHREAHKYCFIANSVNFPITINPVIIEAKKMSIYD